MAATQIFSAALGAGFAVSLPFTLYEDNTFIVLEFKATVTVAATIQWFFEFTFNTPDVGAEWYRETSQENAGSGVVAHAQIVRTLQPNGGGTIAPGTAFFDAEFVRKGFFGRVQVRQSAGTVTNLTITNVFHVPTS